MYIANKLNVLQGGEIYERSKNSFEIQIWLA